MSYWMVITILEENNAICSGIFKSRNDAIAHAFITIGEELEFNKKERISCSPIYVLEDGRNDVGFEYETETHVKSQVFILEGDMDD